MAKKKQIVGIDLGTCYSSIAWVDDAQQVRVLEDSAGDPLMPSAIFITANGARPLVGKAALAAGADDPGGLIVEMKRLMDDPHQTWKRRGIPLSPVTVASILLRQLKEDFEHQIGPIERVAVTVPAHYGSFESSQVEEAARLAGLPVPIHLVKEPIAAALSYIREGEDIAYLVLSSQNILVFDLGGGTFDLGIVRYDNQRIKVLDQATDPKLGGIDWNRRLELAMLRKIAKLHGLHMKDHPREWRRMQQWIEATKRAFSDPAARKAIWSETIGGKQIQIPVTPQGFDRLCQDLADRTFTLANRLARAVNIPWNDLHLLAVGGSTRMPIVQRVLEKLAGLKRRLKFHVAPDLAVVHGAALFAKLWTKAQIPHQAGVSDQLALPALSQVEIPIPKSHGDATKPPEDAIMEAPGVRFTSADAASLAAHGATKAVPEFFPASSRTLGIAVYRQGQGLTNRVLIPRNSALPAEVKLVVRPAARNARRLIIQILEGDHDDLSQCLMLCTCVVQDTPTVLTKKAYLTVKLKLTQSNFLEVVVTHATWGKIAHASHQWTAAPRRIGVTPSQK